MFSVLLLDVQRVVSSVDISRFDVCVSFQSLPITVAAHQRDLGNVQANAEKVSDRFVPKIVNANWS